MISRKTLSRQIGERVKKLRKERGISQYDLAQEAGLYITYIGKVEKGTYMPTIHTLYKIASALKIHPKDLLD